MKYVDLCKELGIQNKVGKSKIYQLNKLIKNGYIVQNGKNDFSVTKSGKEKLSAFNKQHTKFFQVNELTGETEEVTFDDVRESLAQKRNKEQAKRNIAIHEYLHDHPEKGKDGSPFVWLFFTQGEKLFPQISPANLTRLMYISSFCSWEGELVSKSQMKQLLGISRNEFAEFWEEMINNEIFLVSPEDKKVRLSSKFVSKGKLNVPDNCRSIRIFADYVRAVYENCDSASDHKGLAYLFKMIPFVDLNTNIVCADICADAKNTRVMSIGEFCEILGYDKNHSHRMVDLLDSIRINGEKAIGFIRVGSQSSAWSIIVNLGLCFGGNRKSGMFYQLKQTFANEAKLFTQSQTDERYSFANYVKSYRTLVSEGES